MMKKKPYFWLLIIFAFLNLIAVVPSFIVGNLIGIVNLFVGIALVDGASKVLSERGE
ncbi:MAG: hypothetical protein JSW41_04805 [Candidatus Aenigmatarchaeota archaeon]|nr:MAG: hypothetical protein JSW41_04805 [Candidatus Aenigmarchaeota archaeon]